MKKELAFGLLGAALATVLAPFELKRDPNGDFSYTSILVGVKKTKAEDGETELSINFFNRPPIEKIADSVKRVFNAGEACSCCDCDCEDESCLCEDCCEEDPLDVIEDAEEEVREAVTEKIDPDLA